MEQQPKDLRDQWQKEQDLKDMQNPTGPDQDPNDPLQIKESYNEDIKPSSVYDKVIDQVDVNELAKKELEEESKAGIKRGIDQG